MDGVDPDFRSGYVDFCGVRRQVNFAFTPDIVTGDFLLVHVGVALTKIDEDEAARTYQLLEQIGALDEVNPNVAEIVLDLLSWEYHELIMAGAGGRANDLLDR